MSPGVILSLAINFASIICSIAGAAMHKQALITAGRMLCISGCSICFANILDKLM